MARRKVEAPTGDEHEDVIRWYRERLAEPAQFPWAGTEWEPVRIGPTWQTKDGQWVLPDATIGWDFLGWCGTELQHGRGRPWRFTLEQARFFLHWFAVDERGRWLWRDGVLQRLKGWGKDPIGACWLYGEALGPCRVAYMDGDIPVATDCPDAWVQTAATSLEQPLALDTPVQTPGGWSTVGELDVGDVVFDSAGRPTPVVGATPVLLGEPCYRVAFDDHESIVASASHGWTVERRNGHGDKWEPVTLTTAELEEHLRTAPEQRRRVRIPLVAIQGGRRRGDLPVEPYLLGLWLGDGATKDATIAYDSRLRDEYEVLIKPYLADWETVIWDAKPGTNQGRFRIRRRQGICPRGHDYTAPGTYFVSKAGDPGCRKCVRERQACKDPKLLTFRERLRAAGVLGNKHIPDAYARGSYEDRLELLRGLVDSDGWIDAKGRAGFVNANVRLFDQVCDLLTSLGFRWSVTDAIGTARRVHWVPRAGEPVARLSAKVARHRDKDHSLSRYRRVTSVTPVASVPVRCIAIDTPDHLFLAGRRGTLTHNTKNTMRLMPGLITPEARSHYRVQLGKELIHAMGDERLIQAVTSSPATLEGARATAVLKNETQHWLSSNDGHEMAAVIERNATKSPDGTARSLAITNAPEPAEESVAQHDREAWEAAQAGETLMTGLLYDSLEAPPEAPLSAEAAPHVVRAIRGDSEWLDVDRIVQFVLDTRNPPSRSRRFWYNQIVAAEDAWVVPQDFDRLARSDIVAGYGDEITLFFDGSKSDDATGLTGCRVSDGHTITLGMWQRPPGERGRDWTAPRAVIDHRVDEVFDEYNVVAFFADPSHTKDDETGERYWDDVIDGWHRRYQDRLKLWAQPGKHSVMWDMTSPARVAEFTAAAERCADEIESGTLTWDGDARLRQHVHNARRYPNRYGVSLWKGHRESKRKIDLAVCMVGARMVRRLVLNQPEEEKRTKRPGRVVGWN